jgi:hypothetical protein
MALYGRMHPEPAGRLAAVATGARLHRLVRGRPRVARTGGRRWRSHDCRPGDEKLYVSDGRNLYNAHVKRGNLASRRLASCWRTHHLGQYWPKREPDWRQYGCQVVGVSLPACVPSLRPLRRGRWGGRGRAPAARLAKSRRPQETGRREGGGRRSALVE